MREAELRTAAYLVDNWKEPLGEYGDVSQAQAIYQSLGHNDPPLRDALVTIIMRRQNEALEAQREAEVDVRMQDEEYAREMLLFSYRKFRYNPPESLVINPQYRLVPEQEDPS